MALGPLSAFQGSRAAGLSQDTCWPLVPPEHLQRGQEGVLQKRIGWWRERDRCQQADRLTYKAPSPASALGSFTPGPSPPGHSSASSFIPLSCKVFFLLLLLQKTGTRKVSRFLVSGVRGTLSTCYIMGPAESGQYGILSIVASCHVSVSPRNKAQHVQSATASDVTAGTQI